MPGNGNGGVESAMQQAGMGSWVSGGEGGQVWQPFSGPSKPWVPPKPAPPPPKFGEAGYVAKPGEKGWVRQAKNVQRAKGVGPLSETLQTAS